MFTMIQTWQSRYFEKGVGYWWVEGFVPGPHLGGMGHLWVEGFARAPFRRDEALMDGGIRPSP